MEEVLYDTSALISFLKKRKRAAKGFTTVLNIVEFPKALNLKELAIIYPRVEDYDEAVKMAASLLKMGKPMPAIDILIASMCLRRNLSLLTADEHFRNIMTIRSEFRMKLLR